MPTLAPEAETRYELARVLVIDDNPASRLTLQTLLQAGGYRVDSAATAAEAVGKLDEREYELVLSDPEMESHEAGMKVLSYAQSLAYQPATAVINSDAQNCPGNDSGSVLVAPQDVPGLLGKVASLIGERVIKRLRRRTRYTDS